MFETNPQLETARNSLVSLGSAAQYGELFTFDKLKTATGVNLETVYSLIDSVNKTLLQDKRMFRNIRGVGYKIALPQEHTNEVVKRKDRAVRQIRKGVRIGEGTDLSKLTLEEQGRHLNLLMKMQWDLKQVKKPAEKALKNQEAVLKTQQSAVDSQREVLTQIGLMQKKLEDMKIKLEGGEVKDFPK